MTSDSALPIISLSPPLSTRLEPRLPVISHRSSPFQVGSVSFDRQGIADHASQLAKNVQGNLQRSLEALKVVSHVVNPNTEGQ